MGFYKKSKPILTEIMRTMEGDDIAFRISVSNPSSLALQQDFCSPFRDWTEVPLRPDVLVRIVERFSEESDPEIIDAVFAAHDENAFFLQAAARRVHGETECPDDFADLRHPSPDVHIFSVKGYGRIVASDRFHSTALDDIVSALEHGTLSEK